ncbi:phosphotransferase [Vibrio tritonius]|uniref:phosphotransferase n=1 Tax=Vibrio tritonius TaxID=1435069 RepID=UPI00315D8013
MAKIAWAEACQLDPTLLSLTRFFDVPPTYAETLAGGLTNRCWKVIAPHKGSFVWRPITELTKAFTISRFQEYQILKAIEHDMIAPNAAYINDQGLLVEWVDGELFDDADFDIQIKTLVRIHLLDKKRIPVAPFNYTARVDHYWMQLDAKMKDGALVELYHQWRSAPALDPVELTLCHFDLGPHNLIKTPQGLSVIDWEYAGIADPRLDLAMLLTTENQLEPTNVARYCQLRDIDNIDGWVEGVKQWSIRVHMMALLWYLLAFQLRGEPLYEQQAIQIKENLCK